MLYSYIIYKLIFPNGKIYIGQTSKEFDFYMKNYKNNSYNKNLKRYNNPIYRAIRKYGWNNIKKEILFTTSAEFVDELETKMIAEHNATDNKVGYNILKEAKTMRGFRHSEETKRKIREKNIQTNSGKNHPFFGKHHTEETKQKMKKPKTDEHKINLSKSKLNKKQTKEHIQNRIRIIQKSVDAFIYKTGEFVGTFESIKQAGEKLKINKSNISAILNNRQKTANGISFKYNIGEYNGRKYN